jgi:hypothetical protein
MWTIVHNRKNMNIEYDFFCRLFFSKIELSLDIQFNVEKAGKFPATHKEGGILFQALMAGNESQQWL